MGGAARSVWASGLCVAHVPRVSSGVGKRASASRARHVGGDSVDCNTLLFRAALAGGEN